MSENWVERQRFEEILLSVNEGIVCKEADGRITFFNRTAQRIFGISEEEANNLTSDSYPWGLIHEDGSPCPKSEHPSLMTLRSGKALNNQIRGIARPGRPVTWLSINTRPLTTPGRELPTAVVVSFSDISQQKQAEEALAESELRFRQISRLTREFVWEVDKFGLYTYLSPVVESVLGYKPEELVGKSHFYDLHPVNGRREFKHKALEVFNRREPFVDLHNPAVARDGSQIWLATNGMPVFDSKGRLLGYRGSDSDITDRKLAERDLLESKRSMEIERNLLQEVMNGAKNIHLVYLDLDFNFVRVNKTYAQNCGFTPEELVGKNHFDLYPDPENEAIFARVRDTGVPFEVKDNPFTFPDQPRRGVTYWDWSLIPVKNQDGEVMGLVFSLVETTARKRAEEEFKQSRIFLDSMTDIAYATDLEGNTTWANSATVKIAGLAPDKIAGKPFASLFWDADRKAVVDTWQKAIKGEALEKTLRLINGRTCIFTFLPRFDSRNQITGTFGTARDITDRIAKEMEYGQILKTAIDGIWMIDSSGYLREVNQAAANILGYTVEEMAGLHLLDIDVKISMADVKAHKPNIIAEGGMRFESRHKRKDGSLIDVEVSVSYIPVRGGRYIAFVRDISAKVTANRALQEAEERFRLAFNTSPDAININRLCDGMYIEVNQGFLDIMGFDREDVVGKTSLELDIWVDPKDRAELVRGLSEKGFYANLEAKFRRKDGSVTDGLMSASVMQFKDEAHIISITRDIGAMRKAEEEREVLKQQLQRTQRMDALGTLSSGIAHDFNNLLAAIMGYAELALEDVPQGSSVGEDLVEITKAATRARNLVRQILTFSRDIAGERRPILISEVAKGARSILVRTIPKMIKLEFEVGEDISPIKADPGQMEQVLINLASNAADAIDGSGTVKISAENVTMDQVFCGMCGQKMSGTYVRLSVRDNGAGMPAEVREKIFDPFFTTKGVGKGTGLGLSTVYGIVIGHGGHIQCRSEQGRGTEFLIHFPAAAGKAAGFKYIGRERAALPNGNGTVLVVDDEYYVRDIAYKMLTKAGYRVLQAGSGEQALEVFKNDPGEIDLILMDLGMPGMGGKACLAEIGSLDSKAKILIASGYIQYELTDEIKQLGAAGMVSKPYRRSELLQKVNDLLTG